MAKASWLKRWCCLSAARDARRVGRLSTASGNRTQRLFFALWPDAATRAALAVMAGVLRRTCGGRAPRADQLHLTLAFLGDVPEARSAELADLAAALRAQPFVLNLDQVGWWRRHRLVWAAPQTCPPALEVLAAVLAGRLQAGGFHTERRRFLPHVTLLRDAGQAPALTACAPLTWRPTQFVLACSQPASGGVRYRIVGNWPLRPAAAGL